MEIKPNLQYLKRYLQQIEVDEDQLYQLKLYFSIKHNKVEIHALGMRAENGYRKAHN